MRRLLGRIGPAPQSSVEPAIQDGAVSWTSADDADAVSAKIDAVARTGGAILVAGWCTGVGSLRLRIGDSPLRTLSYTTPRRDAAAYLGKPDGDAMGRILIGVDDRSGPLFLDVLDAAGGLLGSHGLRQEASMIDANMRRLLQPALAAMAADPACPSALQALVAPDAAIAAAGITAAIGTLDDVWVLAGGGAAVARGWLVTPDGGDCWLEDASGRRFPMQSAQRVRRDDVVAEARRAGGHPDAHAGFLLALEGVEAGSRVQLMVADGDTSRTLSSATCADRGVDAVAASRWLFDIRTPIHDFSRRVREVDLPVLGKALDTRRAQWPQARRIESLGEAPATPKVSIVVPLYARLDFVEHQLMEFARDPWLLANAEILYVVDDPDLVDPLAAKAAQLFQLWGVPFRWIWGGLNRGFAGANNLGAAHARAPLLLFLNSDVIPNGPGWLDPLVASLETDPRWGAVGPRLLFADGSIQHAGMAFEWRPDLGIWTNQHPLAGLEPDMDRRHDVCAVPAVTGACLLLRRDDFDAVDGWDTGYLIGDFEDSDLCLSLRRRGRGIGYCPQVELTHLERQSMPASGAGDYRMRVVIFNAVRHEMRWGDTLARESCDAE